MIGYNIINKSLASNLSWSFIAVLTNASLQFAQLAVLARYIEPESFAILGVVNVIFALFLVVSDFGLVNYQLANKESYSKFSKVLPIISLAIGLTVFLLCLSLSPIVSWLYQDDSYGLAVRVLSFTFLCNSLCSYWYGLYSINMKLHVIGKIEIFSRLVSFVVFLLLVAELGVIAAVISISIFFGSKVVLFVLVDRSFFLNLTTSFLNIARFKNVMAYSARQVSSQWLGQFAANIDSIILSKVFDSYWFGLYSAGKDLSLKISMLLNPVVARVCTPYLANFKRNMSQKYLKANSLLLLVTFIGFGVLIISNATIISLLYGENFQELNTILPLLFIWAFLRMNCAVSSSALIVSGKVGIELAWNVFCSSFWFIFMHLVTSFNIEEIVGLMVVAQLFVSFAYITTIQKTVLQKFLYSPLASLFLSSVILYGITFL